jgi:hypothetical protein
VGRGQQGQSTVEWIALLALVSAIFLGLVATGARVPGTALARAVASAIACGVADPQGCGVDEPALVAAYGSEVGRLARDLMPTLAFEDGSRALPVDFRRCRASLCADGREEGLVTESDSGEPVTAFVHVVDRRPQSDLYIQYWLYYPESATLRGVPIVGAHGYHRDDWESVQLRVGADGEVEQRASSHNGYNHGPGIVNWGSDAGIGPLRRLAEAVGARAENGWGPRTDVLFASGGSHAGSLGDDRGDRFAPGRGVRLIPLEPIAAAEGAAFAVSAPWQKQVWRDPEATGTG